MSDLHIPLAVNPLSPVGRVLPQENRQLCPNFAYHLGRGLNLEPGTARPPIQTPDLIGKNDSRYLACRGKQDFERIALDPGRDGTKQRQAGLFIIALRAQNQRGTVPGLLMAGLRRKRKPYDVPLVRNVPTLYHCSLPWVSPMSCSG